MFKILFFVFSITAQAVPLQVSINQAKKVGAFDLAVGSSVTFAGGDTLTATPGLFLGELTQPSGEANRYLFLDLKNTRVYFVPKTEIEWSFTGTTQPVLNPYAQVNGTCASYGMFHYFLQLNLSKTLKSSTAAQKLNEVLSSEQGRTQLLAQALDGYYIERPNRTSIIAVMKKIGDGYGLKCSIKIFKEAKKAVSFLKTNLDQGIPVVVAFNVGSDMMTSTYEVSDYEDPTIADPRIWIPRQVGQRQAGGHTIVLASSFYNGSRFKAVSIDSDWEDPRIWDVQSYINDKTAMAELEFYTCQ